jgi:hypothetical protein
MAAGTGFIGYLSVLKKGAAGAGATIGEVISISGPEMETDVVEITHLDSANAHKDFIPGLIDAGSIEVELQLDTAATVFATLVTDFQARTTSTYHILFSNTGASTLEFSAFITSLAPQISGAGERVTVSIGFKVTTKPTWTT